MIKSTYTQLSYYHFKGFFPKYIAISLMGFSKFIRVKAEGMKLGKLLGTGSGLGFSQKPNWGKYAHIAVWETKEDAENYYSKSHLIKMLERYSFKKDQFEMLPYQSKGVWDGKNPYEGVSNNGAQQGEVAILTRAKVKIKNLPDFWKYVKPSNKSLSEADGRIYSAGMGEWPFSHPITFSVWESLDHAVRFAHGVSVHGKAAKAARDGKWFREDLFVRFAVKRT
ncbi:MAG: hypothetical protein ACI9G9_000407 [Psychromonas sp.]|jgi:hypothetical protein